MRSALKRQKKAKNRLEELEKTGLQRPGISRCPGENKKNRASGANFALRFSRMTKRDCFGFPVRVAEITLDTSLLDWKTQNTSTVH